jgi:hypothetical protein
MLQLICNSILVASFAIQLFESRDKNNRISRSLSDTLSLSLLYLSFFLFIVSLSSISLSLSLFYPSLSSSLSLLGDTNGRFHYLQQWGRKEGEGGKVDM